MTEGSKPAMPSDRVLVYYFAFPRYRREILQALQGVVPGSIDFISGSTTRASISALEEGDVEALSVVPSFRLGPVSWDRGVLRRAMSRNYGAVVLGPATLSLTTWLVLICRRLVGRRTYLWGQCGKFGDRSLKRRLQEVMNRLATGLLVYGENEAVAATQLGLSRGRVHIVHNATRSNADVVARDDSATQFVRLQEAAEAARSRGEVTFLYVGRLNQDKRISVLLQAAERLRSSGFEAVSVDLIGDGDAKAELEAAYPHDWVRFHGWVFDSDELSGFFERATFVCSPWDMGLVAIDALRSGTPVLVPDNPRNGPEVEALTAGVNAALFTPGEPESLVAAARGWLDSVERIDLDRYRGSRIDALAVWDPASVAKAISRAVTP